MKLVSYWCEHCGSQQRYPDCGGFDVHLPCAYCGITTRHNSDKYEVVCGLENRTNFLLMQLGRLVGLETLKEMADEKTLRSAVECWKSEATGR